MVADIIRPSRFSVDPQLVGPVHRMRLANANATNSFHVVRHGLDEVAAEGAAGLRRADDLGELAERLSRQMRCLMDETRRFVQVLRAD